MQHVGRADDGLLAVRRKGDSTDVPWPTEPANLLARLQIPEDDTVIESRGKQALAVGRECQGRNESAMSFEPPRLTAVGGVPDANGRISAAGSRLSAVGTKGNAPDRRGMTD